MPSSDPSALKRSSAGSYRTIDGRFTVEQASGRWLVLDGQQQDDLGLPLTRGPFATLDAARAAIADARQGPAPTSELAGRLAAPRGAGSRTATPRRRETPTGRRTGASTAQRAGDGPGGGVKATTAAARPPQIRAYRAGEGPAVRAFWATVGFKSLGDDDESLARLAERNPGLVVVAAAGDAIVATALGAWDGRRGWIYHVAVAEGHRRMGLGRRIVHEVERRLRALGCPKVNVIVRDADPGAGRFWEALGYTSPPARQYGKEL